MELRQYVNIVWKRLWLIILTTALGGGSAFYFNVTAEPVYRSTTTLEISQGQGPSGNTYQALRTSEMVAQTYTQQIQDPVLLERVADKLNLEMSGERVKGMITVEQVRDTQLIRLCTESNDPALAKALAETIAQTFIEQKKTQQRARFQADLEALESQIESLEASIAETQAEIASLGEPAADESEFARVERRRLESELNRDQTRLVVLLESAEEFRLAMSRQTDNITIYSPAQLPTKPSGPGTMRNTLLGGVTGMMIGVGTAFLLEYLDDTIRTPEDVKRSLPVGVLGTLPRMQRANGQISLAVAEDSFHPVAEAFRNLRTSIRFSAVDEPVQTLLVTSPLPTEGKTFTAANLGAVMAQGGQRVIVVDADLRRPLQHRVFRLPKEPGLTSALLSEEDQHSVLRDTDTERLQVVTSGPQAPNPAELVASERFRAFVSRLKEQADIVIFDSPPTLAVSDAAVLSTLVDGTLLVVDYGETRKPAAAQAVERLMDVGGNVLGVVLNRVAPNGDGYYYYNYYYYSERQNGRHHRGKGNWLNRLLRPRHRGHSSSTGEESEAKTRKAER